MRTMNDKQTHRYTLKQRLQMTACSQCRACVERCPAVQAAGDGRLSALYRVEEMVDILKRRTGGVLMRLLGKKTLNVDQLRSFSETVFRCTLCGNCQQVCPVGLGLKDLWIDLRRDLVKTGTYPKKIDTIESNLKNSRNVFDEDNEERAEWVEDLDEPPDDLFIRDTAEVVYFTGCTAAFFPAAQKISLAMAQIFTAAAVDFTLLGEDEWCCGFPMLGAGLADDLDTMIAHNIQAVKARKARKVVFSCPSCYHMWRTHYPIADHGIEIFHSTQFIATLIGQGTVHLKPMDLTVTYHDPCDLGRGAAEYEAPRQIIQSIPGVTFVELPDNREACNCCGGGGNLEMIDSELSTGIAQAKIEEIRATGAGAVVTSCQQCVRTMLTYVRRNKIPLEVMDITEFVLKALAE